MMTQHQAAVPQVLASVAIELDIARDRSARLDNMLSALAERASPEVLGALSQQLQAVDLLNQQLHALHGFLAQLADARPLDELAIDTAADAITLRETALRLRSGDRYAVPEPPTDAGDLDLF